MKTTFLLIVLTQNGAGDINASFANTETLEQCQQKELMLKDVFMASNIPLLENRCVKSELKFSAFEHATTASRSHHFYLLEYDEETVVVKKMADWRACKHGVKPGVEGSGRRYCASSVQWFE